MNVQPLQVISIILKKDGSQLKGHLITLSDEEIILSSKEFFACPGAFAFQAHFFRGQAILKDVVFADGQFTFYLEILSICFRPGLLIDTVT
jgi:hypothetical protein